MKNITLRKCAYIFHWTNSTYSYGTREQIERKHKINNALKELYQPGADRVFKYTKDNNGNYCINLYNEIIKLTPMMILSVEDESETASIINNLTKKRLEGLQQAFNYYPHTDKGETVCSKKLKSLSLEQFMGNDDLGYYRLHFGYNWLPFLVCGKNLYTENLNPLSYKDIYNRLNANGKTSKAEIKKLLDYLTEN